MMESTKNNMNHGSLFSGIGGFDLAAQWVGWKNVFQVENDKFCNKILKKNFPKVKRYGDIKEFTGQKGQCDIISGGFPCQPFSQAGKRQGEADNRFLWYEMLRVIREIKPQWVIGENVTGLLALENGKTFDRILTSLEDEGYEVESFIIPACGVGAWHRRDRIWIIANNKSIRTGRLRYESQKERTQNSNELSGKCGTKSGVRQNVPDTEKQGLERTNAKRDSCTKGCSAEYGQRERKTNRGIVESGLGGVASRIPDWLDEPGGTPRVATGVKNRVDRLKGLGNAIVPQVAFELFKAIDKESK